MFNLPNIFILTILIFTLNQVSANHIAYKKIEFGENGFPKSITIRIKDYPKDKEYPSQVLVTHEAEMMQGLDNISVVSETDEFRVLDLTINFEDYIDLDFFDDQNPSQWEIYKVAGPARPIPRNTKFIPIIVSDKYLIGIIISSMSDEPFVAAWRAKVK